MQGHPWERRDDESSQAWGAFETYRDLSSKRTLRAVATKLGKSETLMSRWSSDYDWPNRARLFDRWMDQQATTAWADEYRAMVQETNALGRTLVSRAMQRLGQTEGKAIPSDAIRAAEVAAKIQNMGMMGIKPETQGEKESAVMVDAAALVEEMYRRARDPRDA